jgi:hypothetical protein
MGQPACLRHIIFVTPNQTVDRGGGFRSLDDDSTPLEKLPEAMQGRQAVPRRGIGGLGTTTSGEHVKYLVYGRGQPIACLAWSSSPRHLGPRDRFIGWSAPQRRAQIHLLAYNTRYLILPWVKVRHLASHLLGRVARRISDDWQQLYQHPIYLLETFIEPARFRGTCYRAANWLPLGLTTGRGKDDLTHQPNRSLKELWVQPLGRDFRQRLCREGHE